MKNNSKNNLWNENTWRNFGGNTLKLVKWTNAINNENNRKAIVKISAWAEKFHFLKYKKYIFLVLEQIPFAEILVDLIVQFNFSNFTWKSN